MAQRLIALALSAWLGVASSATAQPNPPTQAAQPSSSRSNAGAGATAGSPRSNTPSSTPPRGSGGARAARSARTTPTQPGAHEAPTASEEAEEEKAEEEEDDWGVLQIQLLGGYSFANLVSFRQDNFLPTAERLAGSGFFGGAGLGFRVHIVTLGAQATIASYAPAADDGFELGTAIATVALHLPTPGIQPYFRFGAGYAWMGKANYLDPGISETRVYGFVLEGGFGIDIKLGRPISLGLGVDAAYLNLGRQSTSELGMIDDVNFEEDGDAVGYQLRGHVHLTFHI